MAAQAWWPQRDAELYTGELWSREFSFTWDFSRDLRAAAVTALS